LIIPIKQYFTLYEGGKSIWKNRTLEIDYLARIAFQINHILKRVNDQARKEIKGRLRSDDPRSVLFESVMVSHFIRHDYGIEFVEYERTEQNGRTFDFLVSKNGFEAEVECKFKSYDTGRKITRAASALVCDLIIKCLSQYYP
jgi:hypothetical protein